MRKALIIIFIFSQYLVVSQDSTRISLTSSVGILLPISGFGKAYKKSLALNSGIEYSLKNNYFAQFTLDFNAVKYNQQIKDQNSNFLFQNTNSTILLVGFNFGKSIPVLNSKTFQISPYIGGGYANFGEPRLFFNNGKGIITQQVVNNSGLFTRMGTRIMYNTKSKFLQTIYLDLSYWSANNKVQENKPKAVSIFIGTRFSF